MNARPELCQPQLRFCALSAFSTLISDCCLRRNVINRIRVDTFFFPPLLRSTVYNLRRVPELFSFYSFRIYKGKTSSGCFNSDRFVEQSNENTVKQLLQLLDDNAFLLCVPPDIDDKHVCIRLRYFFFVFFFSSSSEQLFHRPSVVAVLQLLNAINLFIVRHH